MQVCPSMPIFYIKEMKCPYQGQAYVFENNLSKNHRKSRVGKLHLDPGETSNPSAQGLWRHTQCQQRSPRAGLPILPANESFKACLRSPGVAGAQNTSACPCIICGDSANVPSYYLLMKFLLGQFCG